MLIYIVVVISLVIQGIYGLSVQLYDTRLVYFGLLSVLVCFLFKCSKYV